MYMYIRGVCICRTRRTKEVFFLYTKRASPVAAQREMHTSKNPPLLGNLTTVLTKTEETSKKKKKEEEVRKKKKQWSFFSFFSF